MLEVKLITPARMRDKRGFFSETYNLKEYKKIGIYDYFVQDNHSLSSQVGTLRGLHFQKPPKAQCKLVRCGKGAIFDVAVDIRLGSPTYCQWVGYTLSAENGYQLYVPKGFAHGFITLETNSEILYKCSDYYAPEMEGGLRWDDPVIGINWPLKGKPTLSDKDTIAPLANEIEGTFIFGENC